MKLLRQLYKLTNDRYTPLRPMVIKVFQDKISEYAILPLMERKYKEQEIGKNAIDANEGIRRSMQEKHLRKVREIEEFIKTHPLTTNYFYDEMQRIKRQNTVKDDLRKMVTVLESIPEMKKEILEMYRKLMKNVIKISDFWERNPNDLVINPFGGNVIDPTYG